MHTANHRHPRHCTRAFTLTHGLVVHAEMDEALGQLRSQREQDDCRAREGSDPMTLITRELQTVQAKLENLQVTVQAHDAVLKCGIDVASSTLLHSMSARNSDSSVWCRNHNMTMLTEREIQEDFTLNRRDNYAAAGSCLLAAREACNFFEAVHKLMSPAMVHGVLYSPSGAALKCNGREPAAEKVLLSPRMQSYVRKGACLWVPDPDPPTLAGGIEIGYSHTTTAVSTADSDTRVTVDWSAAQFDGPPPDLRLYVTPQHPVHHAAP